jgi:hypothetical protein
MEVSDEYFEHLKRNLLKSYEDHEKYQNEFYDLTGRRWVPPFYTTDYVNRVTLEPTKGGDA